MSVSLTPCLIPSANNDAGLCIVPRAVSDIALGVYSGCIKQALALCFDVAEVVYDLGWAAPVEWVGHAWPLARMALAAREP